MGRKSALEIKMAGGRILRFLLEREDSRDKMMICERYIEKLFKSKNSSKKKEYRTQVLNIMKFLVRDSTDKNETETKLKAMTQRFHKECDRRSKLQDDLLVMDRKLATLARTQANLETERAMRRKSEEDYGKLLTEFLSLQSKNSF